MPIAARRDLGQRSLGGRERGQPPQKPVDHAVVAHQPRRHAGRLQPPGVGLALIAQRVELRRQHQRTRQAGEIIGPQRRGVRLAAVLMPLQILSPEPLHGLAGEHISLGMGSVRRRLEVVVGSRIDQHLQGGQRRAAVAAHQADHSRQVPAGAVAGHGNGRRRFIGPRLNAQALGVGLHPARGGEGIFRRSGKLVLRRQAVIDGRNQTAGSVGQRPAQVVVRGQVADHPAAAVEENHRPGVARSWAAASRGRPIEPQRNVASRRRDPPLFNLGHGLRRPKAGDARQHHLPRLLGRALVNVGQIQRGELFEELVGERIERHRRPVRESETT